MSVVLKVLFVASMGAIVTGCAALVVAAAFGWPLTMVAIMTGVGAGVAGTLSWRRIIANLRLSQGKRQAAWL